MSIDWVVLELLDQLDVRIRLHAALLLCARHLACASFLAHSGKVKR